MKTLGFVHAGTTYKVSLEKETLGQFVKYGSFNFSLPHNEWVFKGVSKHHWANHIQVPIKEDVNPKDLIGGLVWDIDHGTMRTWAGQYCGRLPRITQAWVE